MFIAIVGSILVFIVVVLLCAFADEYWYICCAGGWIVFIWVAWLFHSNGGV